MGYHITPLPGLRKVSTPTNRLRKARAIHDDPAFLKLVYDEYPTPMPGPPATTKEALRPFKRSWPKKNQE